MFDFGLTTMLGHVITLYVMPDNKQLKMRSYYALAKQGKEGKNNFRKKQSICFQGEITLPWVQLSLCHAC